MIKRFFTWICKTASDFDEGYLWAEKELAKGRKHWEVATIRSYATSDEYERGVMCAIYNHAESKSL